MAPLSVFIDKTSLWGTVNSTKRFLHYITSRHDHNNEGLRTKEPYDSSTPDNFEIFQRYSISEAWVNGVQSRENADPLSSLNLDFDFDQPSLDFEVSLHSLNSKCTEVDSIEKNQDSCLMNFPNDSIHSRFKNILGKVMTFFKEFHSLNVNKYDTHNKPDSPITTMKIPVNNNYYVSKALDISIFKETVDESHSTIKFSQFADILVYNKNSDEYKLSSSTPSVNIFSSFRQNSRNRSTLQCPNSVHSILKNKVNHNFSEEFLNAKLTDSINLDLFLRNFESFENEKFRNCTGVNEKRLQQLRNYYTEMFT